LKTFKYFFFNQRLALQKTNYILAKGFEFERKNSWKNWN